MIEKFISYYKNNKLFNTTDNILLTVSGGKDSMTMLNLFKRNNLSFGIAHCNFQLRGEEAKKDEEFVKEYAENNNIPFYTIAFNTKEYAVEKGVSIQMAARELRYDWFEKIKIENDFEYIATAHHKNDVAETMLINITKGTGLAGLHGIANKNGNIIRPLLCFNRAEIDDYVKENNISYREDLSNSDTKYTRNLIRHTIIPELEKINSALIETLNDEANQFLGDEKIILSIISKEKKRLFLYDGDLIKINISELKKLAPLNSYLYYFLRDYGFNSSDVYDITKALDSQSGKKFYSTKHEIIKDRDLLILNELEPEPHLPQILEIKSIEEFPFNYELIELTDGFKINKSDQYAYLDADAIQFPLTLRKWKEGDSFQPLGMNGNKKVSDFLIDNKVTVIEKKDVQVLESNSQIIWLVGYRIDNKFRIKPSTKNVFILSI